MAVTGQTIPQFENDAFGGLFPHAGNGRQSADVAALDGAHQVGAARCRTAPPAPASDRCRSRQSTARRDPARAASRNRRERAHPPARGCGCASVMALPGIAQTVEGAQGHRHVVADSVDVDDDPIRMLLENAAAEEGDHDRSGLIDSDVLRSTFVRFYVRRSSFHVRVRLSVVVRRSARLRLLISLLRRSSFVLHPIVPPARRGLGARRWPGTVPSGPLELMWQIATARASAASCGVGTALRPRINLIMACTWRFSARP